jgi:hypothetical protein
MLVVFRLVNLYPLLVYVEHNGDESPKDYLSILYILTCLILFSVEQIPVMWN